MAINSIQQLVDAENEGRTRQYTFRHTTAGYGPTAGTWWDMSFAAGQPAPKYWFDSSPLVAKAAAQSTDGGFYHGENVAPYTKYLRSAMVTQPVAAAVAPWHLLLCDYLLYYPSIDETVLGEAVLTNSVTLPRYETGEGVYPMAVNVAPSGGVLRFTINYTNSDGVSGRTSATMAGTTTTTLGNIKTSGTGANASSPFIVLQDGDKGVRSIESVNITTEDVGLFSIVLVKPLASLNIFETTAVVEKDFFVETPTMPVIKDDAFLNFLLVGQGSFTSANFQANIKTVFN